MLSILLQIFVVGVNLALTLIQDFSERKVNPILAREGDFNIGHLAGISQYDEVDRQCGSSLDHRACEVVSLLIYTIEQINTRSDLLPNITLGFVNADCCSNDMKCLEVATYLLNDDKPSCSNSDNNRSNSYVKNGYSTEVKNYEVVGIIGPYSSREAVAVASLMSVYKIPMIGIYVSSDELSDKSRYEYFLRLSASDRYQVFTMLMIVKHFGWKYVSVIYSEGSYGENAMKQIDKLLLGNASTYGICIAVRLQIPSLANDDDYNSIIDGLLLHAKARVVLLFADKGGAIQAIFVKLQERSRVGTFVWLGSDFLTAWQTKAGMMHGIPEGTIYVTHPSTEMPNFEKYVKNVKPLIYKGNDWILKFWENKYRCTFNCEVYSSENLSNCCSMNLTLDNVCPISVISVDNRVYDAVHIFAQSLHYLIEENCPRGFRDKSALRNCIRGKDLLNKMKNSTFETILGRISFDAYGNIQEDLIIKQFYMTDDGTLDTKTLGTWNSTEQSLYVNESDINWKIFNSNVSLNRQHLPPESICSKPCDSNQYTIQQSPSCCWICGECRNNEVMLANRTGCVPCPAFMWPENNTGGNCVDIIPTYLDYSNVISICLMCLSAIVCMSAIVCGCVLFANRQNKLVKALSIHLSLLILLGKLVVCIAVISFVIPPDKSSRICVIRSVGFHFGTCMIYAPLLIKNVRIYRIFTLGRKSARAPRFVSPKSQVLFVVSLYLIQLVLITTSEVISTSSRSLKMSSPFEKFVELYCLKSIVWFLVPLSFNVVIMLLCASIGFVTRKLPNNFNESWFIFISVATTLFAWSVFIPVYLTVSLVHLQSAILGFALLLNCIVALLCQYLPILYALVFVPEEKVVTFSAATADNTVKSTNVVSPCSID